MSPFGGATYEPTRDRSRLLAQMTRVWNVMNDGHWRSLSEIATVTGDPLQSISARLRDFRKARFGKQLVERRYVTQGVWEYRLLANTGTLAALDYHAGEN